MRLFVSLLTLLLIICAQPAYTDDISSSARKVITVPGKVQVQIDYTGDLPIYVGYAEEGSKTTDTTWLILKITYSGTNPTVIQTAVGAWDSRTDYTYK